MDPLEKFSLAKGSHAIRWVGPWDLYSRYPVVLWQPDSDQAASPDLLLRGFPYAKPVEPVRTQQARASAV